MLLLFGLANAGVSLGQIGPGTYYVLVSLKDRDNPSVRAYRINGGVVSEEPIEAF